jgi:hypothetical protein
MQGSVVLTKEEKLRKMNEKLNSMLKDKKK